MFEHEVGVANNPRLKWHPKCRREAYQRKAVPVWAWVCEWVRRCVRVGMGVRGCVRVGMGGRGCVGV